MLPTWYMSIIIFRPFLCSYDMNRVDSGKYIQSDKGSRVVIGKTIKRNTCQKEMHIEHTCTSTQGWRLGIYCIGPITHAPPPDEETKNPACIILYLYLALGCMLFTQQPPLPHRVRRPHYTWNCTRTTPVLVYNTSLRILFV